MADKCAHCGKYHESPCPRVKAVEYYPDGTVKRVEYIEPQPLKQFTGPWMLPPLAGMKNGDD